MTEIENGPRVAESSLPPPEKVQNLVDALETSIANAKARREPSLPRQSQKEKSVSEHHCDRCDVAMKVTDRGWHPVGGRLVVGTMCHCADPNECDDHWEFFVDPVGFDEEEGTLRSARRLTEEEMREIAWLVEQADSGV